jgi:hypothetical protein
MDDTNDFGNDLPDKETGTAGETGKVPEIIPSESTADKTGNNSPRSEPGRAGETGSDPEENPSTPKESPKKPGRPHLVTRVTELNDLQGSPRPTSKERIRRKTMQDLRLPDPEIPYLETERAIRDLVCSILEWQDRMNEVLLRRIIELETGIRDLKADRLRAKKEKISRKPEE